MTNENQAITYSLLAHVRNKGTLVQGPLDVFEPIVKIALNKQINEISEKGRHISEIQTTINNIFSIDIPLPVLYSLMTKIAQQVNTPEEIKLQLYKDKSFSIRNLSFDAHDRTYDKLRADVLELERLFTDFCKAHEVTKSDYTSILDFLTKKQKTLSTYISDETTDYSGQFIIEAQFVEYFRKLPIVYDKIKRIYIGAILSNYLTYKPTQLESNVELLLDTNFLLGLFDLNTPESTQTCVKLIDIAKSQGYVLSIMDWTVREVKSLLRIKAENFGSQFLQGKIYPEDIYGACDRRGLQTSDLELIIDRLEQQIKHWGIEIVTISDALINQAKESKEYSVLQTVRNVPIAALHDAIGVLYVRMKRGSKVKNFEQVNCWFLNNSTSKDKFISVDGKIGMKEGGFQPEIINADDFLSVLWLSSPQVQANLNTEELGDIGLAAIVSLALTEGLPSSNVIRELEENIIRNKGNGLTDLEIVRLATRITSRQLSNVEDINELAKSDEKKFIARLRNEAKRQKEKDDKRRSKLDAIYTKIADQEKYFAKKIEAVDELADKVSMSLAEVNEKEKRVREELTRREQNLLDRETKLDESIRAQRKLNRDAYIENELWKWRRRSWIEFFLCFVILVITGATILYNYGWNLEHMNEALSSSQLRFIVPSLLSGLTFIITGIILNTLISKYRNHSNIKAFKEEIKLPTELMD